MGWASNSWFRLRSWSQGWELEPCIGLCPLGRVCLKFFPSPSPLPSPFPFRSIKKINLKKRKRKSFDTKILVKPLALQVSLFYFILKSLIEDNLAWKLFSQWHCWVLIESSWWNWFKKRREEERKCNVKLVITHFVLEMGPKIIIISYL